MNRAWWLSGMLAGLVSVAGQARAADKPDAKAQKMGLYVQMINAWVNPLYDNRSQYFDVVNKESGITCKESNIRLLKAAPEGRPGEDLSAKDLPKFRAALKKAPKLETDAAAAQMIDAMSKILAIDNNYFYDSKYLDDDCKRGKELHAMLLATWPKFFEAERQVRAATEKYTDEQELVKLGEAEKKYGKGSFHWYERRLLLESKTLIKAVEAASREPGSDPVPVHQAAAAVQKTYDELHPLYEKFSARADSGDTAEWSYLLSYAHELARSAEARAHSMDGDLKAKKPNLFVKSETEQVIKAYNDLVGSANRLTFSKTMK